MSALRFGYNCGDGYPVEVKGDHVLLDKRAPWDTPQRGEVVKLDGQPYRIMAVSTAGNRYDLTLKESHEPLSW